MSTAFNMERETIAERLIQRGFSFIAFVQRQHTLDRASKSSVCKIDGVTLRLLIKSTRGSRTLYSGVDAGHGDKLCRLHLRWYNNHVIGPREKCKIVGIMP